MMLLRCCFDAAAAFAFSMLFAYAIIYYAIIERATPPLRLF